MKQKMDNQERTTLYHALWSWGVVVAQRYRHPVDFDIRYRSAVAIAFSDYGFYRRELFAFDHQTITNTIQRIRKRDNMAFDLSFGHEFFMLPGELYDGAEYPHGDEPYSVLGALRALDDETWRDIAMDIFGMGDDMAEHLNVESVLTKIRETNTCTTLGPGPVSVWIDEEGFYTVDVYNRGDRPDM
tara:strand:- start:5693 stop:6250 length:558 start_codon:yes stop_codon:yes gene_type:complete